MASKREKGKIGHSEWAPIMMRHTGGETLASIARSYGCTAPAIRYIVNRQARAPELDTKMPPSAEAAGSALKVAANAGPPSGQHGEKSLAGKTQTATRHKATEMANPPQRSGIDRRLREQVNSDIAAFLVAFDAALLRNSSGNRDALLDATDRLLRAGARTRITLEQMAADDAEPVTRPLSTTAR